MGKYILRNATTRNIQSVYLLKSASTGTYYNVRFSKGNDGYYYVYGTQNRAYIENANIAAYMILGGGAPGWFYFNVDYNSTEEHSVRINGSSYSTITGHSIVCLNENSDYFYIEPTQGEPMIAVKEWNADTYEVRFSGDEIVQTPMVEQIQKASSSITSIFPGVTYNGTTVAYNPIDSNPYTVEVYGGETLLDSWTDCDAYYLNRGNVSIEYPDVYVNISGYDGNWNITEALNGLYNTDYEQTTIQYSTATSGNSWNYIGGAKPFPNNVKRVRVVLDEYQEERLT